jgi:uncharacterized protein YbbK (DUF523 family)
MELYFGMLPRPSHLPSDEFFHRTPPTEGAPIPILISGCLGGIGCAVDGGTYGDHITLQKMLLRPNVRLVRFCPEHHAFGTPRLTPDMHGGNGYDVLDGKARVLAEDGSDWTDGMVKGALAMRELALREKVQLAVLMDMSGACGSTVVYLGSRFSAHKEYQRGPGVAAAALLRTGIPIISQRDVRSLTLLRQWLEGVPLEPGAALDHWEKAWYQEHFAP